MGCDIHTFAERKVGDGWEYIPYFRPFSNRTYRVFGFLASARNYSATKPIAEPRGLPEDLGSEVRREAEYWDSDGHTHSWLLVKELLEFDYSKTTEDRRMTRTITDDVTGVSFSNGGCTAEEGEGEKLTYRDFLGEGFFRDLDSLKRLGADRVVLWFDN